jgi:hypothetical protein
VEAPVAVLLLPPALFNSDEKPVAVLKFPELLMSA